MSKTTITSTSKDRRWLKRILIALAVIIPLAVSSSLAFYYFKKYNQLDKMTGDQFTARDNERTIQAVSKLYSLPKDEQPSIATIKDKEAVKKQYPFLEQAENADVLLLYQKAQLAIIYRPSTKQLVKVGALNVQDKTASIKIIGTQAARTAALKTLNDNKVVATDAGDAKAPHTGVTVVDVSGNNASSATQLATLLKGQVAQLPAGEEKPSDADLLVIVGDPVTP